MSNLPTVDIIFPSRNRAWILPYFLECIYNLDYPKDKISIITCVNDSIDETLSILQEFKKNHKGEYKNIDIFIKNFNAVFDDNERYDSVRKQMYPTLAKVRNLLLKKVSSDYAFSIDTDILCNPDCLYRLIMSGKDIISSIIYNGYVFDPKKPWRYTNICNYNNGQAIHFGYRYSNHIGNKNTIVEVGMTGAVYLISNIVCKKCEYGFHNRGEDFYFCDLAHKLGFKTYSDIGNYSQHIMSQEFFEQYLKGNMVNGEIKES